MTPHAIGEIQADVYDLPRHQLAKVTATALAATGDARLQTIGRQLAAWDGNGTVESTALTFLMEESRDLEDMLVAPKMGAELVQRYDKDFNAIVPLERVVLTGDTSLTSIGITRATVLAAIPHACTRAADALGATSADGISKIELWGTRNQAIFDHPMGRAWPLTMLFNIKPFAQAGDGYTVYAAKPDHGPASRMTIDLSDWDNSSMVLTLGESGLFNSKHYQDETEAFAQVRWVPFPFSEAGVAADTKDTLTLNP